MKQEILCEDCAKRTRERFPTNNPYPGEYVKFVDGTAKKACLCDGCPTRRPIAEGEPCTAFSIWAEHGRIPYYPWEQEFLNVIPTKEEEQ